MTYFIVGQRFDSKEQEWNILYMEHLWNDPPEIWPRFEDSA